MSRTQKGTRMHAIQIQQFGGPEVLELVELPDPGPEPAEVVLAIEAAGVNRADVLVRTGRHHRAGQPPLILGVEGAGTVLSVGSDVDDFVVGQRVVAIATNAPGFYADRAVIPATQVARGPTPWTCAPRPRYRRRGCRPGTACPGWQIFGQASSF